ncbi:mono-functional DNA-alkylating methyl methanesulfonate N-term-domain-containing protein [Zopfochytrium polystomum]|nr:mono-functional DNA-alkylating methyl methanesulfonate N-term-domain-containing protein [Zopfochytrium polystomum]
MAFHIATVKKPDSVSQTLRGSFTAPDATNVILCKWTHLEVYVVSDSHDDLILMADIDLPCRVSYIELFRPAGEFCDHLFIATEKCQFFTARWNVGPLDDGFPLLVTEASADFRERTGSAVDTGRVGSKDAKDRVVALHVYKGLLRIVLLNSMMIAGNSSAGAGGLAGATLGRKTAATTVSKVFSDVPAVTKGPGATVEEGFNLRVRELRMIDFSFVELEGDSGPVFVILSEDTNSSRTLTAYKLDIKLRELVNLWGPTMVVPSSSCIIPIPLSQGGGLILSANQSLSYFGSAGQVQFSLQSESLITCFDHIEGTSFSEMVVADEGGSVFALCLDVESSTISLDRLGKGPQPTSITALGDGLVVIGSHYGDSILVRLRPWNSMNTDDDSNQEHGFEDLKTFSSLAPTIDFCVVDTEKQGQGKIVACCGTNKDGSLRVVRRGMGLTALAEMDLSGFNRMWPISIRGRSAVVLSFLCETRIIGFNFDEEVEEIEIDGFTSDQATIFCGNFDENTILQVTRKTLQLVSIDEKKVVSEWKPPNDLSVNQTSFCNGVAAVGVSGGVLYRLIVNKLTITETGSLKCPSEISCLDLMHFDTGDAGPLCAVGLWNYPFVNLLWFDSLTGAGKLALEEKVLPRSVCMAQLESYFHVFVALGDGHLVAYQYDVIGGGVKDRKTYSLGLQPFEVTRFQHAGKPAVFAASDRPTILHCSGTNQKLTFSTIGVKDIIGVCPLPSTANPDALAIGTRTGLTIGLVDAVQRSHIKTVRLHESPRRICYAEALACFGVLTSKIVTDSLGNDEDERFFLKLFDEDSFEVWDQYTFELTESAHSICSFRGESGTTYFAVGTAQTLPYEEEASNGRILIFKIQSSTEQRRISLEVALDVKGCVYAIMLVKGRLVAGINNRVQVFQFIEGTDLSPDMTSATDLIPGRIVPGRRYNGFTQALYLASHGDFVAVGDILNSVTILQATWENATSNGEFRTGRLAEVARDFDNVWTTAVEAFSDDLYVCAEAGCNVFVLKRRSDDASDDVNLRLELTAQFHLGAYINKFRHGSLFSTATTSDSKTDQNSILFCTVSGMIGAIRQLEELDASILGAVQVSMEKILPSVGGISNSRCVVQTTCGHGSLTSRSWRAFTSDRRAAEATGFIDGDLLLKFFTLSETVQAEVVSKAADLLTSSGTAAKNTNEGRDTLTVERVLELIEDYRVDTDN